jgi:hypothetical protein
MSKRDPLHIPLDFETTIKALLRTPPPPADVQGSRAAKPKARKRRPAPGGEALVESVKPKATGTKRKAAKKR